MQLKTKKKNSSFLTRDLLNIAQFDVIIYLLLYTVAWQETYKGIVYIFLSFGQLRYCYCIINEISIFLIEG